MPLKLRYAAASIGLALLAATCIIGTIAGLMVPPHHHGDGRWYVVLWVTFSLLAFYTMLMAPWNVKAWKCSQWMCLLALLCWLVTLRYIGLPEIDESIPRILPVIVTERLIQASFVWFPLVQVVEFVVPRRSWRY